MASNRNILQIPVKKWIFDDPSRKKGPVLVILVPGMIHQVQEVLWWNEAFEVIEATEVVEAVEVIEAAEVLGPGKSLLRALDSSRF